MVENTVGKGEIIHSMQFLLFPPSFQKTCTADILKTRDGFGRVKKTKFVLRRVENIMGNRKNAGN